MLSYLSVCSGIEAATVAWHSLGWRAVGFSEIEPFPSAVLAHHYPQVHNYGDMTQLARRILAAEIEAPDVLVGGTPCQSFSVAGLRAGLADERGALTLAFQRLADAIDHVRRRAGKGPCTIVWENVPGVLSSRDNAFGCFLGALVGEDTELQPPGKRWADAGAVYGPARTAAWRILDAQYFGLAQRRRRVFVVASAGALDPCAVLFELDGMRRDSAPRRSAGQNPAAGTIRSTDGGSDVDHARAQHLVAGTLGANHGNIKAEHAWTGQLLPVAFAASNALEGGHVARALSACRSAAGRMDVSVDTMAATVAPTLQANGKAAGSATQQDAENGALVPVSFNWNARADQLQFTPESSSPLTVGQQPAVAFYTCATLDSRPDGGGFPGTDGACGGHVVPISFAQVRRLTPRECERLQGFPDDYTRIPWRSKPAEDCPDGPRYKALGNSMAVPVMRWIGQRVHRIHPATREEAPLACSAT